MGEERIRPTRSGLFMIELLIAVGVFTLCAAVCVGLFVRSEVMSRESADLTRMTAEARNVVECWKAAGGDFEQAAQLCGGGGGASALTVQYDADWNCLPYQFPEGPNAVYQIHLAGQSEGGYVSADLWVTKVGEAAELLNWNDLAALEVTP